MMILESTSAGVAGGPTVRQASVTVSVTPGSSCKSQRPGEIGKALTFIKLTSAESLPNEHEHKLYIKSKWGEL